MSNPMASDVNCIEGQLHIGADPIANFGTEDVFALFSPQNPKQLAAIKTRLILPISAPVSIVLDIKTGSLVKQIMQQFPECKVSANSVCNLIDTYLLACAKSSCQNRKCTAVYFRDQGLYHLTNTSWVMVCGNEVLGDCGNFIPELPQSTKPLRLAWDCTMPAQDAIIRHLHRLAKHQKTIMPTFAFTLLSALRSEIMARCHLPTFPLLSVVGPQNFGKTVLVSKYCLLYDSTVNNRIAAKLSAFSSEHGLMAAASGFRDQVVLVDDLGIGSHASVTQQALRTMDIILRFAGNDNDRNTSGTNHEAYTQECKTGVAFTGEIPFTSASDCSRIIRINLDSPLRDGVPEDRAIAATAFRFWINWFLHCADQQFWLLDKRLAETSQVVHARLQTTYVLLSWVIDSFYRFAHEMGCISESVTRSAIENSNDALLSILNRQLHDSQKAFNNSPLGNLAFYILKGYSEDAFHVVPSRKKLSEEGDCIIENGALCITVATLCRYINHKTPYHFSERKLGKTLQEMGVCPVYKEHKTAGKRIKGQRYLEISFQALHEASERYKPPRL